MKKCPYCAEEIQNEAVKCRFCGESLISPEWRAWVSNFERLPIRERSRVLQGLGDGMRAEAESALRILAPELITGPEPKPAARSDDAVAVGVFAGIVSIVLVGLAAAVDNVKMTVGLTIVFLATAAIGVVGGRKGNKSGWAVAVFGVVFALAAGAIVANDFAREWRIRDRADQAKQQIAQRAAEQAAEEEQRIETLRTERSSNFERGVRLLEEGLPDEALTLFAKVEEVDPAFPRLAEQTDAATQAAKQKREKGLLARVQATPKSDVERLSNLYLELRQVDPVNENYEKEWKKHREAAQELQEARRAEDAKARRRAASRLELVSWSWTREYGYFKAQGTVRNISSAPIRNVEVVVRFQTRDGGFVTSASSLIDYNPILPGQVSTWSALTRHNPSATRALVDFKDLLGGSIDWVEAGE